MSPPPLRARSPPPPLPDRLLRERIRKSRSSQHLENFVEEWRQWEAAAALPEPDPAQPGSERLLVVANRLPVTCSKDVSGKWRLQASAAAGCVRA